jgi:hypothetical protein
MTRPEPATLEEQVKELRKCVLAPHHFIERYCDIYDNKTKNWLPFALWPAQREVLALIHAEQLVIILKARQLGLTWLCLAYALWQMIFKPIAKPLVFSRTEEDAMYLLSDERLRGMHRRLPPWLVDGMGASAVSDASKTWTLANGSVAHAFPPNRGDSYTATFALADEYDLLDDKAEGSEKGRSEQSRLLRSVKPTIDHGGKMVLLSRVDKAKPESEFKKTYRAAKAGAVPWKSVFLPWHVHPARDQGWYDKEKASCLARTGSLDDLHEQYPATEAEALAPRSLDKRIPPQWILECFEEMTPLPHAMLPEDTPALPGLEVYRLPEPGRRYVLGGDPAEGNPSSDDSALCVTDAYTGEECASLAGKFQPTILAAYADRLARWYNRAALMVERNNHGHAVLAYLRDNSHLELLKGPDGKPGWLSNHKNKVLLYDTATDAFRDRNALVHSFRTFTQLASIDGNTLRAPEGQFDDRADAFSLSIAAPGPSVYESRGIIMLSAAGPVREKKPLALLTHQEDVVYIAPGDEGWECEDDDD